MEIRSFSECLYLIDAILYLVQHSARPIAKDKEADAEIYNSELARLATNKQNTWYTAPWLYAEWDSIHPDLCFALIFLSQMLPVR